MPRTGPELAHAALHGEAAGRAIARILLQGAKEKLRRQREVAAAMPPVERER
jgi:hypothetical protein